MRVTLDVTPGRDQWTLRGATLGAASVTRGGTVHATVELQRWQGEARTMTLDVPLPRELPPGHYQLWIGGGNELDHNIAGRLPARYRPTSLEDALARLQALHAADGVYAALWARSPDVTREGEDYPELPLSAMPLLASPQANRDAVRRGDWALLDVRSVPETGVIHGEILLDVLVDDRAP
jgi:hypothetical protein